MQSGRRYAPPRRRCCLAPEPPRIRRRLRPRSPRRLLPDRREGRRRTPGRRPIDPCFETSARRRRDQGPDRGRGQWPPGPSSSTNRCASPAVLGEREREACRQQALDGSRRERHVAHHEDRRALLDLGSRRLYPLRARNSPHSRRGSSPEVKHDCDPGHRSRSPGRGEELRFTPAQPLHLRWRHVARSHPDERRPSATLRAVRPPHDSPGRKRRADAGRAVGRDVDPRQRPGGVQGGGPVVRSRPARTGDDPFARRAHHAHHRARRGEGRGAGLQGVARARGRRLSFPPCSTAT